MALCRSENVPVEDAGWVTLEFEQFEVTGENSFKFMLHDGTYLQAYAPCMVNFDRKFG
jgi:hypothetical protein